VRSPSTIFSRIHFVSFLLVFLSLFPLICFQDSSRSSEMVPFGTRSRFLLLQVCLLRRVSTPHQHCPFHFMFPGRERSYAFTQFFVVCHLHAKSDHSIFLSCVLLYNRSPITPIPSSSVPRGAFSHHKRDKCGVFSPVRRVLFPPSLDVFRNCPCIFSRFPIL